MKRCFILSWRIRPNLSYILSILQRQMSRLLQREWSWFSSYREMSECALITVIRITLQFILFDSTACTFGLHYGIIVLSQSINTCLGVGLDLSSCPCVAGVFTLCAFSQNRRNLTPDPPAQGHRKSGIWCPMVLRTSGENLAIKLEAD